MDNFEPVEKHKDFEPIDNFEPVEEHQDFEPMNSFEPIEEHQDFEPMNSFEPVEEHQDFEPMNSFEPVEEHQDFEPMNNFEPRQNFAFEKFSNNNDFEPQESINNTENNFIPEQNFRKDFEPNENFIEDKSVNNPNKKQPQKHSNHEEDEEIKSFKKNTTIAGIVITLILISLFGIAFTGATKKTTYTDVIKERKTPVHKIEELKIIPNKSIFKAGERFKFDISRDIFFKGDIKDVILSFEIPENIPYRQEIEDLVITPKPDRIEQRDDGKYAVIKLKKPQGSLKVHIAGFAKVHTYTPAIAERLNKNIDGQLTKEERQLYTSPEPYIESNDKFIRTASSKFIPKATNDMDTVKNIYDFVVNNLTYDENETGKHKGAIEALRSKRGVCMEFAHLMTALCRTKGIPARVVYGFDIPFIDMQRLSNTGHVWVEAYIPEYGWVVFDPTNKMPKHIAKQVQQLNIQPFEFLTYAFKNRLYLTVDTNTIHMNYKGDGDIECKNLQITLSKL